MREKHSLLRRVILAVVLICLILAGFLVYLQETRNITMERNAKEIKNHNLHYVLIGLSQPADK